jgi:sirohydrochlorin cobaltochelatase
MITREGAGWEVRHRDDADAEASSLARHERPEAAREIAKYDAAGQYRPLKGAPSLVRGWRLVVPDAAGLRAALDFFYPAALGNWVAFTTGRATPVPVKSTFARQTGMYRITGLLDDEDCRTVVAATCDYATRCRRRITWPVASGVPLGNLPPEKTDTAPGPGELPILCLEACSLLVAAARAQTSVRRKSRPA